MNYFIYFVIVQVIVSPICLLPLDITPLGRISYSSYPNSSDIHSVLSQEWFSYTLHTLSLWFKLTIGDWETLRKPERMIFSATILRDLFTVYDCIDTFPLEILSLSFFFNS